MTPEEFDFLLVRQKDYILELINKRKYKEAKACLNCVNELWVNHSYAYKHVELTNLINERSRRPVDG